MTDAEAGAPLLSRTANAETFSQVLREALRVDFDPLSLGATATATATATRKKRDGVDLCCILGVECAGGRPATRDSRASAPIGPHEACTESEICSAYARAGGWDPAVQDAAVLVLKLALSLCASGMPTYRCTPLLCAVADAAQLPHCHIVLHMRTVQISFGGGPVHVLHSGSGKVLHRLSSLHCLTLAAAVSVRPEALRALACADAINARRSPYGWGIEALAYHGFAVAAAVAIFGGGGSDALAVLAGCVPVRLVLMLCARSRAPPLVRDMLLPLVVGAAAPVISVVLMGQDSCHAGTALLSLLLFELPGSELLFAASELLRGGMVGATRLVHAVVHIMFMAVSLAVGWTIAAWCSGHGAGTGTGAGSGVAWTVAAAQCPSTVSRDGWSWGDMGVNALELLPLSLSFFVLVGVKPRELPCLVGCVVATMLLQFALSNAGASVPIPAFVSNAAVLFAGATLGCAHEYVAGLSHLLVLVPIIVLLAPGAGAFKAVLASINGSAPGGTALAAPAADAWFELLMQGVSFGVGEAMAGCLWGGLLARRAAERAKPTAVALSSSATPGYCPVRLARCASL